MRSVRHVILACAIAGGAGFAAWSALAQTAVAPGAAPAPNTQVFPASQSALGGGTSTVDQEGDITLNFVNVDVRDVAKAILGDYLKLNFAIGSNVQGSVTLQTSQPLTRAQVLPALEQALSLDGIALVKANGVYQIVTMADAHKALGTVMPMNRSGGPLGYGVEVVPVRYSDASALLKLLQPIAGSDNAVRVDPARNLLIVEGTAQERQTIVEDVEMLDANWLRGMSFALYTPVNMDAEELATELGQVMGGMNGPAAGVVKLVPLDRLNAVLAISPQQRYLEELRSWVARLDKPSEGNDSKIFVYHVQNGRANELAATLIKTLRGTGSTDTSSSDITTTQTSSTTTSSSSAPGMPNSVDSLSTPPPSITSRDTDNAATPPPAAGHAYDTVEGVGLQGIAAVHITADENNNALVILATRREYGIIEDALHQLDRPPVEVLLEASIAEVTLTNDTQYGLQYLFNPNKANQVVLSNGATSAIAATYPGFSYMFANGNNIQVILNALAAVTHVNVISSPNVMVLNNQTARLEVGDQVPILTAQSVATIGSNSPVVNAVQYMDTGVILKVTPRVNNDGTVMMDVSQEVSGVDDTASSSIGSPTISERRIDSSVAIQDGETVALGGLFTNQVTKGRNGIPFLQDIPYLGNLFRTTTDDQNKTELMVLITPHVVDDVRKARAVTDELRRKLQEVQPLFDEKG